MHHECVTVTSGQPEGIFDSSSCAVRRWSPHPRLVVFSASGRLTASAVEWASTFLDQQANQFAPRRVCAAWDSSGQAGYTSEARKRATQWFMQGGSRKLNRSILLLPKNPLMEMGTNVAITLISSTVFFNRENGLSVSTDPVKFERTVQPRPPPPAQLSYDGSFRYTPTTMPRI
ncbi:MAG: hypothetical protein AAFX94_19035 [Myxococcota bacterium]